MRPALRLETATRESGATRVSIPGLIRPVDTSSSRSVADHLGVHPDSRCYSPDLVRVQYSTTSRHTGAKFPPDGGASRVRVLLDSSCGGASGLLGVLGLLTASPPGSGAVCSAAEGGSSRWAGTSSLNRRRIVDPSSARTERGRSPPSASISPHRPVFVGPVITKARSP